MPDGNTNTDLPTIPILGPLQPWINLIHTVGLPWVIIGLTAYYGIPYAKDIAAIAYQVKAEQAETNKRMGVLDDHAQKAMPMLEEATKSIPLLQAILDEKKKGTAQIHKDFEEFEVLKSNDKVGGN